MPPSSNRTMMSLSQLVQEVRELYLSKMQPVSSLTCNAMSPRVILMQLTQDYIKNYTMLELVKNEPLSEDEEWNPNWDMNLLEPLVEISDDPRNRKRKGRPNSRESRKRSRLSQVSQAREEDSQFSNVNEEFMTISIKDEPPEPVLLPIEDMSHSVPIAAMSVNTTTASPLPLYQLPAVYVAQPQPLVLQHAVNYSVGNTNNLIISEGNSDNPTTSGKPTEVIHSEVDLGANIKQETENVIVIPFGDTLESEGKSAFTDRPSSKPEIIECESPEETRRKGRTQAIATSIGGTSVSPNRKLRDLTFKLVELNNKNLQCDSRIEKIKEEYKKRLKVVEIEKKGIEQEIDKVLASIHDWKNVRKMSTLS